MGYSSIVGCDYVKLQREAMKKRILCRKIQKIINENNLHITKPYIFSRANKEEKKKLKSIQNTVPLVRWQEDLIVD